MSVTVENGIVMATSSTISISKKTQVFEAWGINTLALLWNLQMLHDQNPDIQAKFSAVKNTLFDYLFDKNIGVGFNGVRAFASPGQNPAILATYVDPTGERTPNYWHFPEGWMNEDGTWKPNPAPLEMELLAAAKTRGANVFALRAQGAPWWMTVSKNAAGNGALPNLDPVRYQDYADFIAGVAKRLTDAGYPLSSVSAFEESTSPPQQKGDGTALLDYGPNDYLPAVYNGQQRQSVLMQKLRQALDVQGLMTTPTVASNEPSPRSSWESIKEYPASAFASIGIVGAHGYAAYIGRGDSDLRAIADTYGKDIEVNEDDWGSAARDSGAGNTWQTAVRNAYKIVTYLDNLRMKWWYLWSPGPRLAWFTPKGNLQLKPQYYMLKFVVATLPAGIQMVQTDNPDISAGIVNKNGGKEARILVVNWSTNEVNHWIYIPDAVANAPYTLNMITESTQTNPTVKTGTLSGPNKRGLSVNMPPMSIASVFVMVDGTVLGASTARESSLIEIIWSYITGTLPGIEVLK